MGRESGCHPLGPYGLGTFLAPARLCPVANATGTPMTITCADCGSTQTIPAVPPGAIAECFRCDRTLVRRSRLGLDGSLACAAALFILIPPAVFLPMMQSTIRNLVFQQSRLVSSVPEIYAQVWLPFALGFVLFAFLFPALRAFLHLDAYDANRFISGRHRARKMLAYA